MRIPGIKIEAGKKYYYIDVIIYEISKSSYCKWS
jgi:hypothetical protein